MFSNQSKNTVIHLIKDVITGEKELESIRQSLILNLQDCNISYQTCFLHLSYDKDRITKNDLEAFLQNYQIRYDQREIAMMRFSNYSDFLDVLLPSNQIFLKQYQQKQMNYNIPNAETLVLISKIFCKTIQIIRQTQAYLDALVIRFDKNTLINFLCPKTEKNYPTFLQLLKNLDLDISFEDVISAMRRLDKDEDSDVGTFDWEELIKLTKPPQNQKIPRSIQKQQSSKSFQKQQSSKSINRSEQRQKTDQENISSIRNVQFSQTKSSTQSLKKKASFSIDESILEFQLHLLTIGKINEEIDDLKLELSSRGDYTLNEAFNFFDLDTDSTIGQQDLKLGFLQLGIDTNEYNIRQLLYYYSTHHTKAQIDLTDFKELYPEGKSYERSGSGGFSYETKKLIKQIMIKYLDMIRYRRESIQQLGKDQKNIDLIFNYLDVDQDGLIVQDDFKVLDLKMKNAMLFFKSFQDYKITYQQFVKYFG